MEQQNKAKKILMIDDDEIFLAIMENMLQSEYEIIQTRSGKEALSHLCKGSLPSLILLDIVMPEMDGWETFNQIRGISLLQNVPIAFMSSQDEAEVIKHAKELGAADFIRKPCEREETLSRIEAIIGKNHGPSELLHGSSK